MLTIILRIQKTTGVDLLKSINLLSDVLSLFKVLVLLLFCCALFACDKQTLPVDAAKKELLIYCGTTMAPAIRQLADVFEENENCAVKIIRGGSGNLYRSIKINRVGDLYLPGSESYIEKLQAEGVIVASQPIGCNRAVLLVAKGNPLNISADLNNFINGRYRTILGISENGSIGRETSLILSVEGIYQDAINQAVLLATDSKDIEKAVSENRADLAINWAAATVVYRDNRVDILRLDDEIAPPHPLSLGLLKSSYYPALARRFMMWTSSEEGQAVLSRYGLGGN